MKTLSKRTLILALTGLALVVMALGVAFGPSAAETLNRRGNAAYARTAYDEALALYQAAQIEDPELAQPFYNAAGALYRQGAYEAALEQLQQALRFASDETLVQHSLFNLGNTAYSGQDLDTAVAAYIDALLLNPDDQDAKHNLELALRQQEAQQEEQQQEEQEQQQDQSQNGQREQEQSAEAGQNQSEQPQDDSEGRQEQPQDSAPQGEQSEGESEQPQRGQPQPDQDGTNPVLDPGQRMTAEQAEQLLAAIAKNSQMLQERLGQIFIAPSRPPVQDW